MQIDSEAAPTMPAMAAVKAYIRKNGWPALVSGLGGALAIWLLATLTLEQVLLFALPSSGLPALGAVLSARPEVASRQLDGSAEFLVLASDGMPEVLAVARMAEICCSAPSPRRAAEDIIAEVLRRGAPDNASVIVLDLLG